MRPRQPRWHAAVLQAVYEGEDASEIGDGQLEALGHCAGVIIGGCARGRGVLSRRRERGTRRNDIG